MKNLFLFIADQNSRRLIEKVAEKQCPDLAVRYFEDPLDLLDAAVGKDGRTVFFLDADNDACDGMRLVRVIRAMGSDFPIVFLSRSGRYGVEAFNWGILDYLVIPLEEERLLATLKKTQEMVTQTLNSGIYIRTFGSFEITVNGRAVPWNNNKPKELLAFLVDCRGDSVSSEKIQKTLWPEAGSAQAAASYHTTLFQLRKKLEEEGLSDLLMGSRGSQRVNTELFDCDLYEFEQEIEIGTPASYAKAFELYKGIYLDNNSYEWSRFTRVRTSMQFERLW